MEQYEFTGNARLLLEYVNSTDKNIFLTGKAGTGKTTLLKYLKNNTHKTTAVAAPTGIAAINAGGVTLHSLLQLPFGTYVPDEAEAQRLINQSQNVNGPRQVRSNMRMATAKRDLLRELELLIIDEVSMLRADLTDCIDTVLRSIRRNRNVPFGGLQILFIGDLSQLPPVIKNNEKPIYGKYYESSFFFASKVLKESPPVYIELEKIYRQKDDNFLQILNRLRNNELTNQDIETLNTYHRPDFKLSDNKEYIYLTTHNYKAERINDEALQSLSGKALTYEAEIEQDFPESMYPVPLKATFKKGAKVMFLTNDPTGQKRFFNGKIGFIDSLSEDEIYVRFEDTGNVIQVEPYQWENTRYKYDKNKDQVKEVVKGTFTHFPLKLAHAVTVHKSQGLTFDYAILDLSGSFAPGQMYVALSRLTSLKGLVLAEPIPNKNLKPEEGLVEFSKIKKPRHELDEILKTNRREYMNQLLMRAFEFNELHFAFANHLREFSKDESRSKRMTFFEWTKEKASEVGEFRVTGKKFLNLAFSKSVPDLEYYAFLKKRIADAVEYYAPKLKNLHSALKNKHSQVKQGDGLKTYAKELKELIVLPVRANKAMDKALLAAQCFSEGKYPEVSKQERQPEKERKSGRKKETKRGNKLKKGETYDITLKLYKQGKSLEEIAQERSLALTTIESHIARKVASGEVDIDGLISQDKMEKIKEAFQKKGRDGLNPVKQFLADDYSYGELSLVKAHLDYTDKKSNE